MSVSGYMDRIVEELSQRRPLPIIESVFNRWGQMQANDVKRWLDFERQVRERGKAKGRIGGAVIELSVRRTKKGKPFVAVYMSDVAARYEVTVFEDSIERVNGVLVPGAILILDVEGRMAKGRACVNVLDSFDVTNFHEYDPAEDPGIGRWHHPECYPEELADAV
jgi:DNA polymerase III alpha subunit